METKSENPSLVSPLPSLLPSGLLKPCNDITLRDYFAAGALSVLSPGWFEDSNKAADWCYEIADAMLAKRMEEQAK